MLDVTPIRLDAVMAANSEVSSLIHAEQLLAHIEAMDADDLRHLIHHIASHHDIDPAALSEAADNMVRRRMQTACHRSPRLPNRNGRNCSAV